MKRKFLHSMSVFAVLLSLAACSSSEVDGESEASGEDLPELTEAGTDAVPAEGGAEGIDAPTDDLAAPAEGALEPPPTEMAASTGEPPAPEAAPAPAEAAPAEFPDPSAGLAAAPPVETSPAETTPPVEAPAVESPSAAVATRSQGGSGEFEDYSVQTGDTLMKIAFETYGDLYRWREIYEANRERIADPNNVPRGTVLKLERPSSPVTISRNGDKFTIRPGDTLGTISQEVYGTPRKWRKIYNNNRELIKDPNRIYAGFTLYYTMDEEDRREMNTPQPLAEAQPAVDPSRFPASAENAPVPAVQAMPGAATAEVPPPAAMAPQTMAPAGAQ